MNKILLNCAAAWLFVAAQPALADEPGQIDLSAFGHGKEACEKLTQQTGEKHFYGIGKLLSIGKIPVPAATPLGPDASEEERHSVRQAQAQRVYSAKFQSRDFDAKETTIKATKDRFDSLPVKLEETRTYGFCYSADDADSTTIKYPETIELIKD